MFYSGYDNYMQDIYSFNQYPNNGFGINPNINGNYNPYMYSPMTQANNINPNIGQDNLTNLYPSIYRIINPVISRVIAGNNPQYLTEDNLNNMVDTVFGIVEGQIDLGEDDFTDVPDEIKTVSTNASSQNTRTMQTERNSNLNNNTNSNTAFSNNNQNYSRRNRRQNDILKDLIRVLIIREIISRRNSHHQFQMTNPYMYNHAGYSQNMF